MDLFKTEQSILDAALSRVDDLKNGAACDNEEFIGLVREYQSLLKQLRRLTKISDKTAIELHSSNNELLDKLHYDVLTGIYNRRFLEDGFKRVLKSLSRSGDPLSVLMIDVDFFKKYNDTYGHSKGDECLKTIALVIYNSLMRPGDFVVRYGGEEFIVVLPNTDEFGCGIIANRMLDNVRACNIPHESSDVASYVTVSIGGITETAQQKLDGDEYIKRADEAMYMSKQCGRNKYTFVKFKA